MLTCRRSSLVLGISALGLLGAGTAQAHFVLQSPAAVTEQNQIGDPQKAPPCGDDGNAVATGMVTSYKAGDVVTITINETIFHPGHYRVALAVNDISELPEEPPVTPDNKSDCGSAPIDPAPVFPVLADGMLVHTEPFAGPQTIEVTLPADLSCDNCTLQVIQFMSNHGLNNPGGCYYHHCAAISVEGGEAGTTGGGEASSGEGTAGPATTTTTTATTTTEGDTGAPHGDDSSGAAETAAVGTGTGDAPTSGTTASETGTVTGTAGTTDGPATDDDGGCSCRERSGGQGTATLAVLLGLLGLRSRRRPAR